MTTIIETLENSLYNLQHQNCLLAKNQLYNAVTLLNKDYSIFTEIEPLLEKYQSVENIPWFKHKGN